MQPNHPAGPDRAASSARIYLRLLSYLRPHIRHFAVSLMGYMIFASAQPMRIGKV